MPVTAPQCPLRTPCSCRARRRCSANTARKKDAQHSGGEPGIPGTAVAQGVRQGEDPLPDGHMREHSVDEMGRGVCRASAPTGGAETAALTREGDQAVVTTGVAVHTEEPVREHATTEERAKLLLDEARSGLLSVRAARQEAFELLANDLMKESLLRLMAFVLGHEVPDRDRRGWSADEEVRADRSRWHWSDAGRARVVRCGAAIDGRDAPGTVNEWCQERERRYSASSPRSQSGTIWSQASTAVTQPISTAMPSARKQRIQWRAGRDSNPRPSGSKPDALSN